MQLTQHETTSDY